MGTGCRSCDICKSKSYILDDDCDRCYNCSMDEGVLRWDDQNEGKIEEKELEVAEIIT
jgi:hypothetical protein